MHFAITGEYPQLTLKEEIKYENYLHPYREFQIYEFLQYPTKSHGSSVHAIPKTLYISWYFYATDVYFTKHIYGYSPPLFLLLKYVISILSYYE